MIRNAYATPRIEDGYSSDPEGFRHGAFRCWAESIATRVPQSTFAVGCEPEYCLGRFWCTYQDNLDWCCE